MSRRIPLPIGMIVFLEPERYCAHEITQLWRSDCIVLSTRFLCPAPENEFIHSLTKIGREGPQVSLLLFWGGVTILYGSHF